MTLPSAAEIGGRSGKARVGGIAALLGVLGLASFLRFTNLQSNPGWYSDEGTLADIARHLREGDVQYLAIDQSTLIAARLPLAPLLAAALTKSGGSPIGTLRLMAATSSVLTTGLVFVLATRTSGSLGLGLLSGGLLAVYPPAVFYGRVGLGYSLLGPLVVVALGGLWFYLEQASQPGLAVAALAIGIGSVTELMMLSLAAPLLIVILAGRKSDLTWATGLFLAPILAYAAWMLWLSPDAFGFDLRYILSRLRAVPWWAQLPLVTYNFGTLILSDPWWAPALIGMFIARPRRWGVLQLTMFVVPLILLGRTAGLAGLRLYSISPLFPFLALGTASLLWTGVPWILVLVSGAFAHQLAKLGWCEREGVATWLKHRVVALGAAGMVFLVVISPLIVSTFELIPEVRTGLRTENDWAYLPVEQAEGAIAFVNQSLRTDDIVVASPALAWALEPRATDFQQSLAYRHEASADYPSDLPRSRFLFAADYRQAAMAVVDPIWREWGAAHLGGVREMLREIERWPVVWGEGEIRVHQNPSH